MNFRPSFLLICFITYDLSIVFLVLNDSPSLNSVSLNPLQEAQLILLELIFDLPQLGLVVLVVNLLEEMHYLP